MEKSEYKGCAVCQYLVVEPDPDPFDWFCDDDEKARCSLSQANTEKRGGEPYITIGARPYETMKDCCRIPSWCPLGGAPAVRPEFIKNFTQEELLKMTQIQMEYAARQSKKPENVIKSFTGEYAFLSNYFVCDVTIAPYGTFTSSEAAYQAAKCPERVKEFLPLDPDDSKKLGKKVKIVDNWNYIRDYVMRQVVLTKFSQNEGLKQKLLDTGDSILIEGNTWGDKYWGQVNGNGENMLGKILMEVREYLRGENN